MKPHELLGTSVVIIITINSLQLLLLCCVYKVYKELLSFLLFDQ